MSLDKAIVLTRDVEACIRSIRILAPLFPDIKIIAVPVRRIRSLETKNIDMSGADAVIFTSSNAVRHAHNIPRTKAYCVGEHTANSARDCGYEIEQICPNVQTLVESLEKLDPIKFMHITGRPYTVDFSVLQALSHHQFRMQVCYAVEHVDWSNDERSRIKNYKQRIFPVFSAQSAQSLIENLTHPQSQFCAEIVPISSEVQKQFKENDKVFVHSPPKTPDFASIKASLRDILGG